MARTIRIDQRVPVICTWLEEQGEDPRTTARVRDGQAFCTNCGSTEHEVQA